MRLFADNASLNVEPQSSEIATVTTEVSDEYAVPSEEKLSTEKPKEEKLSLNVNITLKVNNETVEENDATIKENKESVKENKESVKETNGIVKETNGIVKEHNETIKENGDQPKVQTLCVEHEDDKPKKKKKKKFVLRRKSNRKNSQQETMTPKEVLAALEAENKESHAENSKSEGLPTIDKEETKPSNGEIEPRNGGTVFQENNGSAKNDSKSVSEPQMIDSSRDLDTETRGNHVTSENTKEEPEKLAGHGNVSETDARGISDENTETTLETHSKEKKKSKKLKFFSLKSKKRGNGKDKDRDSKLSDAKTTDSLTYSNGVTDNLSVSSELSYDSKRLSQSSQALNEEGENVDIRGSTSSLYVPGEKKKKRFILKRKKKSSKDEPQSDEGKNQGVITNGNTESKEKNQHYLLI